MKNYLLFLSLNWLLALQSRNSGKGAAGALAILLVLGVLGIAALVIALSWKVHFRRRADRAGVMRNVAQQIGFSYMPRAPVPQILNSFPLPFSFPATSELENVMRRNVNGLDVSIFDYRFNRRGSPHSSGGRVMPGNPYVALMVLIQSAKYPAGFYDFGNATPEMVRQKLDEALRAYYQQYQIQSAPPVSSHQAAPQHPATNQPAPIVTPQQNAVGSQNAAESLRRLNELRQANLITEQEYQTKKAEIMSRL